MEILQNWEFKILNLISEKTENLEKNFAQKLANFCRKKIKKILNENEIAAKIRMKFCGKFPNFCEILSRIWIFRKLKKK